MYNNEISELGNQMIFRNMPYQVMVELESYLYDDLGVPQQYVPIIYRGNDFSGDITIRTSSYYNEYIPNMLNVIAKAFQSSYYEIYMN